MVTTYILVLVISAALLAFAAGWVRARLGEALKRPNLVPTGVITLTVAAAMLIVVAAPLWLFAALAGFAFLMHRAGDRLPLPPALLLLIALVPLIVAPLVGTTAGLAIDAALIAAALIGETYAT